jgi:hypothetical protein
MMRFLAGGYLTWIVCLIVPLVGWISDAWSKEKLAPAVYFPLPPAQDFSGNTVRIDLKTLSAEELEATKKKIRQQLRQWSQKVNSLEHERRRSTSRSKQNVLSHSESREVDLSFARSQLVAWQHHSNALTIMTICGEHDRSQDVEQYDGTLGPTTQFVTKYQSATGQIQWNDNITARFTKPGDDAGNINDVRWCTGTLLANNLFISAGHCFDIDFNDWRTPRRFVNGSVQALPPQELAPLMHVNFNYQIDGQTGKVRTPTIVPIVRLVEHRTGKLDYAIVELGKSADGFEAEDKFTFATWDSSDAGLQAATLLTVFQHPAGNPKKVAAGTKITRSGNDISYADIDTLNASSGAGLIDQRGKLIGIHTSGGCYETGGANGGIPLASIKKVSRFIN